MTGGAVNDTLNSGGGADTLNGDAGNDVYIAANAGVTLEEASGVDTIRAPFDFVLDAAFEKLALTGAGNIDGTGHAGNNTLDGNTGRNVLKGLGGNDVLSGGSGHDALHGGNGNDRLYGGAGKDTLKGDTGNDRLFGNDGGDKLYGRANTDTLKGGNGYDLSVGGTHNDQIRGGSGQDTLKGDAGKDMIWGDSGNDRIIGGAGTDTAVYSGSLGRYDVIKTAGKIKVIDTSGKSGTDTLSSVEKIKIGNKVYSIKKALTKTANAPSPASDGERNDVVTDRQPDPAGDLIAIDRFDGFVDADRYTAGLADPLAGTAFGTGLFDADDLLA